MKVYIAGSISKDRHYLKKFKRAEKEILKQGHTPVNPAWIKPQKAFTYEDYMNMTAAMQKVCDAILFIPGWSASNGAIKEMKRARELHQKVYFLASELNKEY